MILRTKNKQLFLVIVPISTETTENRRSVVHGVCEHAELHVRIRNDAALVIHEIWQRHGSPRKSVYHTDRLRRGLALDLKRKQTDQSHESCREVKRHCMANSLE